MKSMKEEGNGGGTKSSDAETWADAEAVVKCTQDPDDPKEAKVPLEEGRGDEAADVGMKNQTWGGESTTQSSPSCLCWLSLGN